MPIGDLRELSMTDEQKAYVLRKIEALRWLNDRSGLITPKVEAELIENFLVNVGFMFTPRLSTCFDHTFTRLVINRNVRADKKNKRLEFVSQIKYPPAEVLPYIPYGRANLPQKATFYASCGEQLAPALETNPKLGDLMTQTKWKQKVGTQVSYVSLYHSDEVAGATIELTEEWTKFQDFARQLKPNTSEVCVALYNFITDMFAKQVDSSKRIEYIFSALFADYFFYHPDSNIDVIIYPSVPSGFIADNVAIKPEVLEEKFELVEVIEDFCSFQGTNNRQWLSYRTAKAVEPNLKSEKIQWQDETIHDDHINAMIKEYVDQ